MVEQEGFTHIKVSTDEDDVVIVAGAPLAVESSAAAQGTLASESDELSDSIPDRQAPDSSRHEADEASLREGDTAASSQERFQRAGKSADEYHETTLEDIEDSKMSGMQKAIIAVALLGIAAFVAWYLLA